MSKVRIPPVMRSQTGGARDIEATGNTVGEVLDDLIQQYPALSDQLYEDRQLRRFVNVYLAGEDIRFLGGLATPVPDGSELTILPAVAGG